MIPEPDGALPNMNAFTQMWSEFMTQMMKAGTTLSPDRTPPEMSRDMRSAMLKAWSDYCDQFMRSADFLNMMKQSLSASIDARKQLNEFLARTQHELQLASRQDVDQIMASIQRMEQRMVDHMDELTSQLTQLKQRLEDLEQNSANGSQHSGGSKKKQTRKKNE